MNEQMNEYVSFCSVTPSDAITRPALHCTSGCRLLCSHAWLPHSDECFKWHRPTWLQATVWTKNKPCRHFIFVTLSSTSYTGCGKNEDY